MTRHLLTLVVVAACAYSSSLAEPVHGTVPRVWMRVGGYETPDDQNQLTEEASYTWRATWGPTHPILGTAYGYADMSTPESSTVKAHPTLEYHDLYGGLLQIASDVGTWKPFTPTSATLSPGDPVTVMLDVNYTGFWYVVNGANAASSTGYASFEVFISDKDDMTVDSLGGEATITHDDEGNYTQEVDGDWVGQIVPLVGGAFGLDYSDTLTVELEVGELYYLYFDLATTAGSFADGATGAWPSSHTHAEVDFANTATYLLHSDDDVAFEIVPEPATMGLLAFGGFALIRRRRAA